MLTDRAAHRWVIVLVVVVLATTGGGLALLAVAGRLGTRAGTSSELALVTGVLGSLVVWRRPSNRVGALLAAIGVLFGFRVLAGGVLSYANARTGVPGVLRQPALAYAWLTQALSVPWALFLLWFPTDISSAAAGSASSSWERWPSSLWLSLAICDRRRVVSCRRCVS